MRRLLVSVLLATAALPAGVASALDEGQIAFQASRQFTTASGEQRFVTDIEASSPAGSGISVLAASCDQRAESPSLSADGGSLLYNALDLTQGSPGLYLRDTSTGATRGLVTGIFPFAAISPDGTRVAYLQAPAAYDPHHPESDELWTVDTTGAGAHRVGSVLPWAFSRIGWSPDGAEIVYSDTDRLSTIRPDGTGERTVVIAEGSQLMDPAWSAQNEIVYRRGPIMGGAAGELRAVNADGSADHVLIPEDDSPLPVKPLLPSWSPSGQQIVYVALSADGERKLVIVGRDGTNPRTLDLGDAEPTAPAWTGASAFPSRPASCGGAPAPQDTVAPRLSQLALRLAKVRRGGTLSLSFRLSEPASLQVGIDRLVPGHRAGGRCVAGRRRPASACLLARRLATRAFARQSGRGVVRLATRVKGRKLTAGRYRLVVVPVDQAGNRGTKHTLRFAVH
jgi:hypothetical protein